ncbi:trefoil factor 1 [Bufo bufo]|uniref:trefoil factor 1 n=1 Tax=Bufo bufo TaxID=8384 RepID=UPI001ABDE4C3|nr:trefoil factor 1 [Bufo bufo]
MSLRALSVLTFTILSVAQLADAQCTLQPKERKNCGQEGITRETCVERGCCFDSSINEAFWCYFPQPSTTTETGTQRTTSVHPGNGTMNASHAGNIGMAEKPLTTTGPVNTTNQTTPYGNVGIGMAEEPLSITPPMNTTLSSSVGPLWSHPSYICLISVLLTTIATMSDI